MAKFIITTNKETALAIENAITNPIAMQMRKLKLIGISHNSGYSDVAIDYSNPEDIFWLGWWTESLNAKHALV